MLMLDKFRYVLLSITCTVLIGFLFFIGALISNSFNDMLHENMAAAVAISVVIPAVAMYSKYESKKQK